MDYLMDKLKMDAAWGLSNDKKRPVYTTKFIHSNNPQDLTLVNKADLSHLSTLLAIESKPQIADIRKAYHLHASDNLVIGFDVEPRCSKTWLDFFKQLPAHYREYSNHYGIHLLMKLNRLKLTPKAFNMLLERTEIKTKMQTSDGMLEYELIMNNHWITITQNICHGGKILTLNEDAPKIVYDILNYESKTWQKEQKTISVLDIKKNVSPLAKKMKATLFGNNNIVDRCNELSLADFENDDSAYEYEVAIKLAGYLNWRIEHPKDFDNYNLFGDSTLIHQIDISDRIQATALEMEEILPKRQKWAEKRHQLPWLIYVAKRAWDYILANDDEDTEFSN